MCNKTLRGATTKGRWKEGIQICYETLHGATTKGRWEELCKSRAWQRLCGREPGYSLVLDVIRVTTPVLEKENES